MKFIIDCGSGNSCRNDKEKIDKIIGTIADSVTITPILKWQLFKEAGQNIPLSRDIFEYAYRKAEQYDFETTASVFDVESLNYLLGYKIPFVKLSGNYDSYRLWEEVPRGILIISSYRYNLDYKEIGKWKYLCTVKKYPAKIEEYESQFETDDLMLGISDHTEGVSLFYKYVPSIYECHFNLGEMKDDLDNGPWAKNPYHLKELSRRYETLCM